MHNYRNFCFSSHFPSLTLQYTPFILIIPFYTHHHSPNYSVFSGSLFHFMPIHWTSSSWISIKNDVFAALLRFVQFFWTWNPISLDREKKNAKDFSELCFFTEGCRCCLLVQPYMNEWMKTNGNPDNRSQCDTKYILKNFGDNCTF